MSGEDKQSPGNPLGLDERPVTADRPDAADGRPVTAETVFNPDGTVKEAEVVSNTGLKLDIHVPNILPMIKNIGKKREIPREVTLYAVFSDTNGELDKIMKFLHIETAHEKKIWFIMWEDISK